MGFLNRFLFLTLLLIKIFHLIVLIIYGTDIFLVAFNLFVKFKPFSMEPIKTFPHFLLKYLLLFAGQVLIVYFVSNTQQLFFKFAILLSQFLYLSRHLISFQLWSFLRLLEIPLVLLMTLFYFKLQFGNFCLIIVYFILG